MKQEKTHKTHLSITKVANQIFNYQLSELVTARGDTGHARLHIQTKSDIAMKTQHFSFPFNKTLSSQPAMTFDADLSGA